MNSYFKLIWKWKYTYNKTLLRLLLKLDFVKNDVEENTCQHFYDLIIENRQYLQRICDIRKSNLQFPTFSRSHHGVTRHTSLSATWRYQPTELHQKLRNSLAKFFVLRNYRQNVVEMPNTYIRQIIFRYINIMKKYCMHKFPFLYNSSKSFNKP